MDNHNPIFEALAKPKFETIKVGAALYREIHVPEGIRKYTDTPKWDQKSAIAASREVAMGELQKREECIRSACAFSDPNMSREETSGDEGGEKRRLHRVTEEGDSAVSCDRDEDVEEDRLHYPESADQPQPPETVGTSLWTEEGPFQDKSTEKWLLKLKMLWPLRTLFLRGKGELITKVSKEYQVQVNLQSCRPLFVACLRAAESGCLLRAREFLSNSIEKKVESLPYTHFISLPLTDPRFQERYRIFKTQVLATYPGFDETLFAKPEGLHITLLLLRVLTEDQEARCREVLCNLSKDVYDAVDTRSLVVHMKGLDLMNDDSSAASVIFTSQYTGNEKDRETDRRLHRLRRVIAEAFRAAGLISERETFRQQIDEHDGVKAKLHATILNAKFRQNALKERQQALNQGTQTAGHARSARAGGGTYDGTQLLSDFKLFDFFECRVPCVELIARALYDPENKHVVETHVRLP